MFDAGWQVGSLSEGYGRPEPEPEAQDVAALLDAAEDIVNSAAPDILSDFEKKPRRFGKRNEAKAVQALEKARRGEGGNDQLGRS